MYSFKQGIQDRINNIEVKNTWCTETFRIGACWFRVCIIWSPQRIWSPLESSHYTHTQTCTLAYI